MKGALFTYALTFGGSAASLFNPFVGVCVYVTFAIIKPDSMWGFALPQARYSRIIALALLAGWLIKGFGSWNFGKAGGIVFAFIAFWVWSVFSAAQSAVPSLAWGYVEESGKILLPFLVGITVMESISQLRILAWVIAASQGFLAYEANMHYLNGFNAAREGIGGAGDNNFLALGMTATFGLSFFLALYSERLWQKAAAMIIALMAGHVVLLSFSRGGMLGLVVTGLMCFILIPKKGWYYVVLLAVVLLMLRLAGPEVRQRFSTSFADEGQRDASAQSRVDLWRDCIATAVQNPVFGVGPNHWRLIARSHGWTEGKSAHTLWLEVLAELGFPGFLFLCLFYGKCLIRLNQLRKSPNDSDPWQYHLACMVIAALVGFAVSGQFVSAVGLEMPYYIVLLGAGVLKLSSLPVEEPVAEFADAPMQWPAHLGELQPKV
ncbi:MAG TPA: O-antigen ligase family protein [Gemmataceae bacterium]|nr:O-antigen ligase family protein [Gemmataceae bacterium]